MKQIRQKLIILLTENEMMARQLLIDLVNRVEEELEDREACEELM